MLQVFCLYVSYVAMTIHVCWMCMFGMFHLFQTYVASILSECYSGYTHILQLYVSNVSPISDVRCSKCFMLQVFSLAGTTCFMRFRCLFHMFYLNVVCVSSVCCKSRYVIKCRSSLVCCKSRYVIKCRSSLHLYAHPRACTT
jgi:hypothetical protein